MRGCRRKSRTSWSLKTFGEYERDEHKKAAASKRCWSFSSLEEMVKCIPEETRRRCFLQFLNGLFQMNPKERWTAKQALQHPFVDSTAQYDDHFQPLPDDVGPAVAWAQPVESISASPMAMSPSMYGSCQPGHFAASSTTGTPASSPHGSASTASGYHSRPAGSHSAAANSAHGSSPWHLASDGGLSTASDCMQSSQPSGSESCSRSLSDGSHRGRFVSYSDSDSTSAMGSHGSGMEEHAQRSHRNKDKLWKNLQSVTRGDLSSRLPLSLESALSPKGAPPSGGVGNFREAVGMGESGPVVPVVFGSHPSARSPGGSDDYGATDMARGAWSGRGKGNYLKPRGRRRKGHGA